LDYQKLTLSAADPDMPGMTFLTDLAPAIDHTALKPETTEEDVRVLCREAVQYGFQTVFTPPFFVPLAKRQVKGLGIAVGTTVGFPLGNQTSHVKIMEARNACARGADVLDMAANVAMIKDGRREQFIREVKEVIRVSPCENHKVIIETCLLTDAEKVMAAAWVAEAGADYVKTSTGFSTGGATVEDVALLSRAVGDRLGIKASGGIRTPEFAIALLDAGASRIGTSSGVRIMETWKGRSQGGGGS